MSAEAATRNRLGIPADAQRVLVFSESSHWDTNWLQTSEEYFKGRLEPIFDAVLDMLERDPARVYCVESVFFLKLYWERHPERQSRLRRLMERRQLRILSSSLTTPDTLLPHPEAILRDYHLGQDWLRGCGLTVVPRTAYFPDNFGHSPHLPSLMRAVGVDAVAVTRIDGMYFIAADYRKRSAFPLKGSTAELLQKELRTLDFVWQDDDGAEVLCHWNAFTYFQGDMLAHTGIVRWNGHVAAIPWRTRGHVARRIDGFVRQLEPLARTPYMLCPIGMDFNDPIVGLPELLDRYNRERYPSTGTWAVLAGLDDYFELLAHRRSQLPALRVDPNPYWMGFYSSRPELKQRPARIARALVLAENLSALSPPDAALEASLREAWHRLVLINHHDAITGTSPDRVCHDEQRGWLDAAEAAATLALSRAAAGPAVRAGEAVTRRPRGTGTERIRWWREGSEMHVRTPRHRMTFSKERGGCLTSLVLDGHEQLRGLGLDLVAFADEGGLWRLGHEFRGGRFAEIDRASRRPAKIVVRAVDGGLEVEISSDLRGAPFVRTVTCRADDPLVHVRVAGVAARRTTVTCRWNVAERPASLRMDTLGGTIERPLERLHQPTFWPVPSVVSLQRSTHTMHVGFEAPSAVSSGPEDGLEWIVARNAPKERAFRILPVLAHPIGGTVDGLQTHRAALFVAPGSVVPSEMRHRLELAWLPAALRPLKHLAGSLIRCSDPAVSFAAVKRADAGPGIIVRVACAGRCERPVRIWLTSQDVGSASLCDAREFDLQPLVVSDGRVLVALPSRLVTLRLVPCEPSRVSSPWLAFADRPAVAQAV
ncbi:MAG TPA: hypothetical protein VEK07_25160 [Polyangiaceae bacterium]|nr:hypothetical protein [Polyangiaceae bacterium]